MAKYWNNDQGITSLGVSASISRVVNQSASPFGSTMASGRVSPTGPLAFLGTGSGPRWPLAVGVGATTSSAVWGVMPLDLHNLFLGPHGVGVVHTRSGV